MSDAILINTPGINSGEYATGNQETDWGINYFPAIYTNDWDPASNAGFFLGHKPDGQGGKESYIEVNTGRIGGWKARANELYSLASGFPDANPDKGIVLDAPNQKITIYDAFNVTVRPRVEVGKLATGVFGIKGFDDDGTSVVFELSTNQKVIAGFTFDIAEGFYTGTGVTRVQMKPGAGFWAGADAQTSAPFYATQAGKLVAANGKAVFNSDGSGTLGDGALSWTAAGVIDLGNWTAYASKLSSGGLDLDAGNTRIRATAGNNYVEVSPSGLYGYDAVLGFTFQVFTDGSAPIFSSGIIKEVTYEMYTSGVIKTSANPVTGGGLLINNASIAGYNSDVTPVKTFEIIYSGTDEGDFTFGDYAGGNHGIFYDYSAGTLDVRGAITAVSGTFAGTVNASGGVFTGYVEAGAGGMRFGAEVQTGKNGIWIGTNDYWYGDGTFSMAGGNVTYASSVLTVTGTINATGGAFSGYVTAGTSRFGAGVQTSKNGIWLANNNYWYDDGSWRVGDATNYMDWSGTALSIAGSISSSATISGGIIQGGTVRTSSGTTRVEMNSANELKFVRNGNTLLRIDEDIVTLFSNTYSGMEIYNDYSIFYFSKSNNNAYNTGSARNYIQFGGSISTNAYFINSDGNNIWAQSTIDSSTVGSSAYAIEGQAKLDVGASTKTTAMLYGIKGIIDNDLTTWTGTGYAIYGEVQDAGSGLGWGGYFVGNAYVDRNLVLGGVAGQLTAGAVRWSGTDFEGYDGSAWTSFTAGGGGGNHGIYEHNDVTISTIATGEILVWKDGPSEWQNNTLSEAGIASSTHNHDSSYSAIGHTHSYLPLSGGQLTGNLTFSSSYYVYIPANGSYWIGATSDSGARLRLHNNGTDAFIDYYNNLYLRSGSASSATRFTLTTGGNLTITGTFSASGYNKSNWDTAYGWGNHAGLYASAGDENIIDNATSIWNADGDGDVLVYNDSNPTHNGKYVGALIYIKGDGVTDSSLVRAGIFSSHHVSTTNGYYVGTILDTGSSSTTQVIDSSGNWVGNAPTPASHNHSASNITSGTLDIARGGTGYSTFSGNQFLWYNSEADRYESSGYSNSSFASSSHNHDSSYVNVSGDTMTGDLNMQRIWMRDYSLNVRSSGDYYHQIYYSDGIIYKTNSTHGHHRFYGGTNTDKGGLGSLTLDVDTQNNVVAVGGAVNTSYKFYVYGTGYFSGQLSTGVDIYVAGNKVWTAGNDGSGSGLDADTVDGYHASTSSTSPNTIPVRDGNGYLLTGWIYTTSGSTSSTIGRIYGSNDGYIRYYTPSEFVNQMYGTSSTTFARGDHTHSYLPLSGGTLTGRLTGTDVRLSGKYERSSHSSGFLEGSYNNVGSNDAKSNPIYTIGSSYNPSDTALSNMYGIGYSHSNFWTTGSGKPSGWGMYVAADGDIRVVLESSTGVVWAANSMKVGSNTVWHAGNDGSGSGLDADTVDGSQASAFATSGHNHTYNVNDGWLRDNGDNANVKLYGNVRQMAFRTDGTSEYASGVGGYPFAWMYGGDSSGNRIMLLNTSGQLWCSNYGWLHSYFATASHNHDSSYVGKNGSSWTPHASTNRDASWNTFYTDYGYIQLGPANAGWAHIYSDKNFYFNMPLYITGDLVLDVGNYSSYALPLSGGSLSGDLTINGHDLYFPRGDSSKIHRVGRISFDWTAGSYDSSQYHGIESKNSTYGWADSLSINSYNDITMRLDSNNNNSTSYLRVTNNTYSSSSSIFYIQSDGTVYSSYRYMVGSWDMRVSSSNLHFYYSGSSKGYLRTTSNVGYIDFTGQHRSVPSKGSVDDYKDKIGLIVVSDGKYRNLNKDSYIEINEALPMVSLSREEYDKRVFGVISDAEDSNDPNRSYEQGVFVSQYSKSGPDDNRLMINSLGEGAMWVCNISGNLENGDYIASSDIPGYGMKQDDDVLHNYTVAKITMDCDFDLNQNLYECEEFKYKGKAYRRAFVGVTYHCG